jgi:Primase C terminal 2 (PriCT-2)
MREVSPNAEPCAAGIKIQQNVGLDDDEADGDLVPVLQTKGALIATKRIKLRPGGKAVVQDYDLAKNFIVDERRVHSLTEFAELLAEIERGRTCFLIRGRPLDGIDRQNAHRRLYSNGDGEPPSFEAAARSWLLLDFDSIVGPATDPARLGDPEEAVRFLASHLPPVFHGASCWWQFTSGAGIKPGIRMRLAYWLSRPLSDQELKSWLPGPPILDHAIFAPVQPIYVARPIFEEGDDPVPVRSGIFRAGRDTVKVPLDIAPPIIVADDAVPRVVEFSDLDRVRSALRHLPDPRPDWIAYGLALRHDFGEAGWPVWHEWSARNTEKYQGEAATRATWDSFNPKSERPITIATIFARSREAGWTEEFDFAEGLDPRGDPEIISDLPSGASAKQRDDKEAKPLPPGEPVSLNDFYAYMPMHNYIFTPTRAAWPAASVNARIRPIKLTKNGEPVLDEDGKPVILSASAWLDRNKPVEQMTWAPGLPTAIRHQLLLGACPSNRSSRFEGASATRCGMSKTFRDWEPDQVWLLPPSLQDLVPTGHVAHFVRPTSPWGESGT